MPKVEFPPGENLPLHLQNKVGHLNNLQRMHKTKFFWVCSVLAEDAALEVYSLLFILLFYISCPTLSLHSLFT